MFYSQTFSKQVIDNLCSKCETQFSRWTDYHEHVMTVNCYKQIKPIRTTTRSKMQIVKDVESKMKGLIR